MKEHVLMESVCIPIHKFEIYTVKDIKNDIPLRFKPFTKLKFLKKELLNDNRTLHSYGIKF